jgi:RNA polymerase sigma-70 factor (ECF subfamily)
VSLHHQIKVKIADLAAQYGRQVFHSAYRLLSDIHMAEDVTQEVFLKLFNKPSEAFDKITHWPGYLKSMAISAAIDQLRRNKRLAEDPLEGSSISTLPTNDHPLQKLLCERDLFAFKVALLRLTTQDAQIFCLRHIEGYAYQEIAELLGITSNLVGVALHRAQLKLSSYLGESQLLGERHAI